MTDELRWPKQNRQPTESRDPYNNGRWPGNDDCPLVLAGKRFARNRVLARRRLKK